MGRYDAESRTFENGFFDGFNIPSTRVSLSEGSGFVNALSGPPCENVRLDLVVLTSYARTDEYLTDQGQTSDAPIKSSTVTQGLRPHHFVQVFVNVYSLLSFLFLELLNDLHINTVSLQQGYSKDIAIYIDHYKKYEADPLGFLQGIETISMSHLHFRLTKHFAHNKQL